MREDYACNLISLGATGWVFKFGERIALKYVRDDCQDQFAYENAIYDILEAQAPCPYIVQSVFRQPDANFMLYMPGGSLRQRIQENQTLDNRGNVLSVLRTEPRLKVLQWSAELASAISFLESLGYAHGDLRPENILLDHQDRIKLADFDSTSKFGTPFPGGAPPWARLRGREAADQENTWGDHGARTEQFAFGSILYTLLRGHEPYEYHPPGIGLVKKLQNMIFPELSNEPIDLIIEKCWRDSYMTLRDLEAETTTLHDATVATRADVLDDDALESVRRWCQEAYKCWHLHESQGQPPTICFQEHHDLR